MPEDTSTSKLTFETAMAELEEIVDGIDGEQIPLDQLINRYERGADLAERCQDLLGAADKRIKQVIIDRAPETKKAKHLAESPQIVKDSADPDDSYDDDIELF